MGKRKRWSSHQNEGASARRKQRILSLPKRAKKSKGPAESVPTVHAQDLKDSSSSAESQGTGGIPTDNAKVSFSQTKDPKSARELHSATVDPLNPPNPRGEKGTPGSRYKTIAVDLEPNVRIGSNSDEPINFPSIRPEHDVVDQSVGLAIDDAAHNELSESRAVPMDMSTSALIGLLFTSGMSRLPLTIYDVVRECMTHAFEIGKEQGRHEHMFGASSSPFSLPNKYRLRELPKPYFTSNCLPEQTLHHCKVNYSRRGAKGGHGKYSSSTTAPIHIVRPSQWARRDMRTRAFHSIRKPIQGNDTSLSTLFKDIEETPLVQRREEMLSIYRLPCGALLRKRMVIEIEVEIDHVGASTLAECGFSLKSTLVSTVITAKVSSFFTHHGQLPKRSMNRTGGKNGQLSYTSAPFLPGDVVVGLRPVHEKHLSGWKTYLVFRACTRLKALDDFRISVAILKDMRDEENICAVKYRVKETIVTSELRDHAKPTARNRGVLQKSGKPYFVYRLLLYCDDFTPQVGKPSSMGGCYLLPVGLPVESRLGAGATRPISLTPPGVSTSSVLSEIVDDLLHGTQNGIHCKDFNGDDVVVFLDVVGVIGDYPAVSHMTGALGHNANVPCPLCFFSTKDSPGNGGSRLGYTTEANSLHPSFARSEGRSTVIYDSMPPKEILDRMGMKLMSPEEFKGMGLVALSQGLKELRLQGNVPLNTEGSPVVPSLLDPYRSCLVAPDHLYCGLAENAIDLVLTFFNPRARIIADGMFRESLSFYGMMYQSRIVNTSEHKLFSMDLSSMYSVLLCAPQCLSNAWTMCENESHGNCTEADCVHSPSRKSKVTASIELVRKLQVLVSRTQHFPTYDVDGAECVRLYNEDSGQKRIITLRKMSHDYIEDVHNTCILYGDIARKYLDKPNLHRLCELYNHTLPLVMNLRHVEELVFEAAHQAMKRGVTKSNWKNEQLQAMEARLYNDLKARLALATRDVQESGEGWCRETVQEVSHLLGIVPGDESEHDLVRKVKNLFSKPVLKALRNVKGQELQHTEKFTKWVSAGVSAKSSDCGGIPKKTIDSLKSCPEFRRHISGKTSISNIAVMNVGEAICVEKNCTSFRPFRAKGYKIRRESVFQGVSDRFVRIGDNDTDDMFLVPAVLTMPERAERRFWVASNVAQVAFLEEEKRIEKYYAWSIACTRSSDGTLVLDQSGTIYFVELGTSTRAALTIHKCDKDSCTPPSGSTQSTNHSTNVLQGGPFILYGREEGYPPRKA